MRAARSRRLSGDGVITVNRLSRIVVLYSQITSGGWFTRRVYRRQPGITHSGGLRSHSLGRLGGGGTADPADLG